MENDVLLQLGVGGIFALLIIKEVLTFVKGYREKQQDENGTSKSKGCIPADVDLRLMGRRIEDLYAWHNVHDADGAFIWYMRGSLEDAIKELSRNLQMQTQVLQDLCHDTKAVREDVRRLEGK